MIRPSGSGAGNELSEMKRIDIEILRAVYRLPPAADGPGIWRQLRADYRTIEPGRLYLRLLCLATEGLIDAGRPAAGALLFTLTDAGYLALAHKLTTVYKG